MFSPPNLKKEILDVLAPVSIILVFTVSRSLNYNSLGTPHSAAAVLGPVHSTAASSDYEKNFPKLSRNVKAGRRNTLLILVLVVVLP